MYYIIFKYLTTATLIVIISEVAKRYDRIGAVIAALPLVTFMTIIWMYTEKTPLEKISNHAYYTFWYVLPTLPMFYLFPLLFEKFGFWGALFSSIIITLVSFFALGYILKYFDINLF